MEPTYIPTHGGARRGAGRKPKGTPPRIPAAKAPAVFRAPTAEEFDYLAAKARHEEFKARNAEIDFRIRAGTLLEKHDVETVVGRTHQFLAQALRSLPDKLERQCGLDGATAEAVADAVDEFCQELHDRLKNLMPEPQEPT